MRHIKRWLVIYTIGAGFILLFCLFYTGLVTINPYNPVSDFVEIILQIAGVVIIFTPIAGFFTLIVGIILLANRGKFSAGRIVSQIGIWFYFTGAVGITLAGFMHITLDLVWFNLIFLGALVGLPGLILMWKLRHLQEDGYIKLRGMI
jgi:hypothetical protein